MESHAKPIAHMALKMMELSEEVLTPDGKPIKVNFQPSFAVLMFIVATCSRNEYVMFQNATSVECNVDVYTTYLIRTLLRISELYLLSRINSAFCTGLSTCDRRMGILMVGGGQEQAA